MMSIPTFNVEKGTLLIYCLCSEMLIAGATMYLTNELSFLPVICMSCYVLEKDGKCMW